MSPELLEIQPRELKFTFELKKQSSCSVQLINKSNHYVAFKVKTTSPKKYCVRPNTGIVLPNTTFDFTVTMQAQRAAPSDLQCRDKFLVQSTIVPFGTTEEDLNSNLFSKENGRPIEENKLRVVLVSPPHSPVLQPINGTLKQELAAEVPVLKEAPILKETPALKETPTPKEAYVLEDQAKNEIENLHPCNVAKDVEDLKSKLYDLETKLNEAEKTNGRLMAEKSGAVQEREKLQQEIVLLRRKCAARVRVGFPFLFVCFVALISLALGYLMRR